MSKKQKAGATDPARFEGNGISYRAKLIGSEDVSEARGDKMCQETIQKLKGAVKASGQHKQRIFVNVTLEGLKIIDGASLNVLHTHPVHQISFISRDVTDSRAFGYVFGTGDGAHKFYGIKTANSAENVVLALRDLFQTVYEMKKQEMEEVKAKAAGGPDSHSEQEDTEKADKAEVATEAKPADSTTEKIEQVALDNESPVSPQEQQGVVANLLDLEDQVDSILKGIEQFKNLDIDEMTSEEPASPQTSTAVTTATSDTTTSTPAAAAAPSVSLTDPWGMPAFGEEASTEPAKTITSSSSSSALDDLEGLSSGPPPSSNPFGGMQAFSVAPPASSSAAFFGMGQPGMGQPGMGQPGMGTPGMGQPGMGTPGMGQPGMGQTGLGQPSMPFGQQGMMGTSVGLPVTNDPFGDPFNTSQTTQAMGGGAPGMMMMGAGGGAGAGGTPGLSASPVPPTTTSTAPGAFGMQPAFGSSPFAPTTTMGTGAPPTQPPQGPFPPAGPMGAPGSPALQQAFGRASPSFSPFGAPAPAVAPPAAGAGMGGFGLPQGGAPIADPFQTAPAGDIGFLQPSKPSGAGGQERSMSPAHANLFNDLLDIKKAGGAETAAKTPKEMFQPPPKKTMNQLKGESGGGEGAAQTNSSPFGDPFFTTPMNGKPSS